VRFLIGAAAICGRLYGALTIFYPEGGGAWYIAIDD